MPANLRTIYKYPVSAGQRTVIPATNAKPVHFGLDPRGSLCVWMEVDSHPNGEHCVVSVIGTGWDNGDYLRPGAQHFMSAVCGDFVWHCYTEPTP